MRLIHSFSSCVLVAALAAIAQGQDRAVATKAPLDHILGTITQVEKTAHTVTVQEDKTATVHIVQLANTKTLLKVEPTAKDLKNAVRITADDLETGDRVDVRGTKLEETPTTLNAKSIILMSGRALEMTHQQQSAAWAHSSGGRVTAVDPAAGTITADIRSAGDMKSVVIKTSPTTDFTRYSTDSGKPAPSKLAEIQAGDQVKVVGDASDDGAAITAQRVYSGAFRTVSVTIATLGADGKSMMVKDLASKKDVNVALSADAAIHKLPPMMAAMLAHRLNPGAATNSGAPGGPGGSQAGGPPASGAPVGGPPVGAVPPGGMPAGGGPGHGDMSQMIDHLPKIGITELKPGDALVISGVATGADNSNLIANTIIAGVEPILQSAPKRSAGGRSVGGDWGLGEMSAPQ